MTMRLFFLILFALSTLVQTRASRALPITFRVKLTDGKKTGKIEIEFYGADDREALIQLLSSMGKNKNAK